MNTVVIAPEVLTFVAAVRARLADLEPEELLEITDGLEADLTDLVVEQGLAALGDPVAYAAELRSAAGLGENPRSGRRPVVASATGLLDACAARFDALAAKVPFDAVALLAWARPLWWVLRAWIAVQLIQLVYGSNPWSGTDLVPHLGGKGLVVLVAAVAASVWVGRSTPRLRERGGLVVRVVLLVVNLAAVVALPAVVSQVDSGDQRYADGYDQGRNQGYNQGSTDGYRAGSDGSGDKAGVYVSGRWVSNIFPYDAAGHPLVGVQLYDQVGKPINVISAPECVYDSDEQPVESVVQYFPWSDGAVGKHNVFPVPSKVTSGDTTTEGDPPASAAVEKPTVSGFPFVSVPKISLPGLLTSSTRTPARAFVPGPRVGPINPIDNGC